MGQLSFTLPGDLSHVARACLDSAAMLGGYDLTPIPTTNTVSADLLTLDRETSESGHVIVPWPVPGQGTPVLMTATLRERAEPYSLLVELARGKLNQVRTQIAEWETAGFEMTDAEAGELRAVNKAFGAAALRAVDGEATGSTAELLAEVYRLGEVLTGRFADLLMAARKAGDNHSETRIGARVTRVPDAEATAAYRKAFNAVRLVPEWRAIEPVEARCVWDEFDALVDWAEAAGLAVSVGPLIDLTAGTCPAWLSQWDGDLPSLAAFISDFVETIISRYRERVTSWQVFAGLNHADVLNLTEDDRLRLAARILESARQSAPEAELGVSVAVPWGDYLVADEYTYSPLIFADTLLRGGFSIASVEVEILYGDGPRTSHARSVLDVYRLLDLFALLGVQLELQLGCPPAGPDDEPDGSSDWLRGVLRLGTSVQQVEGIYWATWAAEAGAAAEAAAAEAATSHGTRTASPYLLWPNDPQSSDRLRAFAETRARAALAEG